MSIPSGHDDRCGGSLVAEFMIGCPAVCRTTRSKTALVVSSPRFDDWQRFFRAHNLDPSVGRLGNCWDNAVLESFFGGLKKERIKNRVYYTPELTRPDISDNIEVFSNRQRCNSHLGGRTPEALEQDSF